jgi:hypothetical protein
MRLNWLPVLVFALAACAPSAGSSPPAGSAPPATFEDFATHACDAFEAMFRAVGNPDAGTPSELSAALDDAIQRGDPAEANRLAEAIHAELEQGRQSAVAASAWAPGAPAMSELNDVLTAFDAYIRAKQEQSAGVPADPQAALEAAGGLTSWTAMFEAARSAMEARPTNEPPHECDGIPMSW